MAFSMLLVQTKALVALILENKIFHYDTLLTKNLYIVRKNIDLLPNTAKVDVFYFALPRK
ncbi:MAG TPA: hypothetical protein GX525_01565 [Bacilli bacterium]|nr:hypothetical protein [Bacilli bacterium]